MTWERICLLAAVQPERAVAALVGDAQLAIVRLLDDRVFAVSHRDPFSGANVMARGIVGSTTVAGKPVPTLASPMYKQAFSLLDGQCLTDPGVRLDTWTARIRRGWIEVDVELAAAGAA